MQHKRKHEMFFYICFISEMIPKILLYFTSCVCRFKTKQKNKPEKMKQGTYIEMKQEKASEIELTLFINFSQLIFLK